jgi:hypothetical protein
MSNKATFWIGVLLALPALVIAGVISGVGTAVVDGVGGSSSLTAVASGAIALALLIGFVVMVVFEKTRWIALGLLAGTAILFVVAAGACVALLAAYSHSLS